MAFVQGSGGIISKRPNIVKGVNVNNVLSNINYDITQKAKSAVLKAQEAKKLAAASKAAVKPSTYPQNKIARLETRFDTLQPGSKPTSKEDYMKEHPELFPPNGKDGDNNDWGGGNYGGTPVALPMNQYGGMSDEDFRANLVAAVKGGIMSEYEANAAVIKNNLANALSSLDSELAALEPLYQNQLKSIASNQFTSGEAMKEMMNQSGWTGSNSGLAIGEQTKIGVAADNSRATALQQKTQTEADINRRKTLEQQNFGTNMASLEAQKNAKLSSAEANALIQSEERRRSLFESDREYQMEVARFQESQSQFRQQISLDRQKMSAAQKAQQLQTDAAAKSQANADLEEQLYNSILSDVYEAKTAEEATAVLRNMGMDTSIPSSIKSQIYDFYDKYVGGMKEYYTEG